MLRRLARNPSTTARFRAVVDAYDTFKAVQQQDPKDPEKEALVLQHLEQKVLDWLQLVLNA